MSDAITRRDFVSNSSKLAMGAMIVPRPVLGGVGYQAPSDTLNIAIVGAGGMGGENAQTYAGCRFPASSRLAVKLGELTWV